MESTPRHGEPARASEAPLVLAFYLPQFHQVPENDAWHGPAFTEWSVVARSNPLFYGHRQPELPGELGFYDLRVPETRYRQARLARDHGISGFLYYHYWFGGRRMLNRPFDEVLDTGQPDFPFALCWTNENWYRRWQGSIDEMLMEQVYSEADDIEHIRWLIKCFKDPRYIRVNGRPLLAIYRPHYLPEPERTVEVWRAECEKAGVEPPWLVGFETGDGDILDPACFGFDASAEFVPHHLPALVEAEPFVFGPERTHRMYQYADVAEAYLNRPPASWLRYPCVTTAWDNSPRRQIGEALILHDSTPERYGRWLREAATRQADQGGNGIVFINAWNEWAEGAHLEPDAHWGRAYLETTRDTLADLFGERAHSPDGSQDGVAAQHPAPTPTEDLYFDLYEQFVTMQTVSSGYLAYAERRIEELTRHYEAKLEWQKNEGDLIAEMNEWLAEQLQMHADRMRQLHIPDVPYTDWLAVRPPAARSGDAAPNAVVRPAEIDAETRAKIDEEIRRGEADAPRRDEGFDDPPGLVPPQWLIDADS